MRRGRSNVILFVGLQGAGKTTTIAKFASYYSKRSWKVSMVCADTFRAGALDQLKQNATKLRIPFYGSYTEADPVAIAQEGVDQFRKDKYEVIIVDTSGRHKQSEGLLDEMQEIAQAVQPDNTVFVMDATQGQAVYDQAMGFREAVDVGAVVVTKLDGHAKGGGALSAVAATQSPIIFLGSGEHFDDFETFNASSFVNKLLGYSDMRGVMEDLQTFHDPKKQGELLERVQKGGDFTLRDLYSQFTNMISMGGMGKMMGNMMPGIPEYLVPKDGNDEATLRLKRFCIMMDSMTAAELDGKVNLQAYKKDPNAASRIKRIARGSGSTPLEVQLLLQTHMQFSSMTKNMSKMGSMDKGKQAQLQQQMRKNPSLINQRLNQMDPQVLQQMGGRDAVMKLLQGGANGAEAQQAAMAAMMGGAGGGGGGGMGGMPGMPQLPPGMDMQKMMQMAQQMGLGGGGGGFPGGFPGAGAGGFPGMPPNMDSFR
uniref:signal-recognition-particle GTPase n=1 Tax=Grammatophora oceanica TaxID=210454 RepID=A0A7S1VS14_9STRA